MLLNVVASLWQSFTNQEKSIKFSSPEHFTHHPIIIKNQSMIYNNIWKDTKIKNIIIQADVEYPSFKVG